MTKQHIYSAGVVTILIVAAFLRFAYLPSTVHFLGDEQYQMSVLQQMSHGLLPDAGPPGSQLGTYHGAFYYYLYFIPALLTHFQPWGTAAFTAILSLISVYLLTTVLRKSFGDRVALFGGFLTAISFATVFFGRWQWNPNTIPFFVALSLFAYSKAQKQHWYLPLALFSLSAVSQLHIVGYAAIPVAVLSVGYFVREKVALKVWLASLTAFVLPWIPTVIHEVKNSFPLVKYFLSGGGGEAAGFIGAAKFLAHISDVVFTVPFLIAIPLILGTYKLGRKFKEPAAGVALGLVVFTFLLYSRYTGTLSNQYAEVFFILFPLMFAISIKGLLKNTVGLVIIGAFSLAFLITNLWMWHSVFINHLPSNL